MTKNRAGSIGAYAAVGMLVIAALTLVFDGYNQHQKKTENTLAIIGANSTVREINRREFYSNCVNYTRNGTNREGFRVPMDNYFIQTYNVYSKLNNCIKTGKCDKIALKQPANFCTKLQGLDGLIDSIKKCQQHLVDYSNTPLPHFTTIYNLTPDDPNGPGDIQAIAQYCSE